MVAVFTGLGAGFERGSGAALGGMGLLGSSSLGRGGESAFFNAFTGNLVLTRQDEFLLGRGPDVAIARTYNSLGNLVHDDNGDLWRQSSDRRVFALTGTVNTTGSTVKRLSADGSEITYTWNGSHYATTDGAGAHDKLVASNIVAGVVGLWTWTDGSTQIKETYEAAVAADTWRIKTQIDLDLNAVTFDYQSGTDRLASVTTADGGSIKYTYDAYGNITAEEVWNGATKTLTRTYYTYESYVVSSQTKYRLKTVTVDLSPNDNSLGADAYTTTYTYDAANRIASVSQTDGSKLDITYDGSGRVLTLSQTIGVDANNVAVAARVTSISYTDEGNGLLRTEITDPRGQVTKLWSKNVDDTGTASTDERGQLVRVQAPPVITGGTPQEVNYTYDGSGNVTSVVTKSGATTLTTTSYVYDANGNVTQITDANGNVTTRAYDANNSITLETRTGSSSGSASGSLHTRYVYDGENHLRFAISSEGRVSEYRYTTEGLLAATIAYPEATYTTIAAPTLPTEANMVSWRSGLDLTKAQVSEYTYDGRGAMTDAKTYGVAVAVSGEAVGATGEGYAHTHLTYDQSGQLLTRYTGPNQTETFAYDGLGRLKLSTDLAGGTTTIGFADTFDTNGKTYTTVTTASGYTTVSTYNKAGDLLSSVDSGANTYGGTWSYLYDKNGQVRVAIKPSQAGSLARFDKSYFLYDKAGRKIADIGHDGQVIEYKYDALNRIVATARYNTLLTAPQLTTLGDPNSEVEIASIRPAAHANDVWQWNVYDTGGRVVETILGDGSVTTYAYDQADRLIATTGYANKLSAGQVTALIGTPPSAVITPTANAANDRVSRSFYDRDGRLTGALNSEGALTRILYDSAGQKIQETSYINLTSVALRAAGTFDQLLASITPDAAKDVTNRYVYDGQGLLRYTIDALNRVTEYVYWENTTSYATGLVRKAIAYAAPLGTPANYSYATVKSAVAALAVSANDRAGYNVYNDRGQLSYAVDAAGAVTGFVYDNTGRITKTTQFAVTVTSATLGADNLWKANLDTWATSNATGARITRNFYAARGGDLIYSVDAEGYVTKFDYEAQGRVFTQYRFANAITVSDATTIANIDAANKGTAATTSYRHDALGRQNDTWDANGTRYLTIYNANGLKLYEAAAFWQGADERFDQFEYDQAGRLVRETRGAATPEAAVTQYAYDGLGNVSTVTDPLGHVTAFTYDKVGRVVSRTEASGTSDARITSYEYDAFGRGVKTTSALGAIAYAYFDRLSRVTLSIDAAGYASETSYNAFGEVGSVTARAIGTSGATSSAPPSITTNSADQTTTFGYDKNGRLTSRTNALGAVVSYQLDAFGNVVKSIDARSNASFFYYDKLGQLKLAIDAEGYATETNYDAEGRATAVMRRAQKPSGTGNVNVWPTIVTDAAADAQTVLGYDALGRVISTTDASGAVTTYEYDRRGNQTKTTNALGGVTERKFDDLDRLIEETVWFGDYNVAGQAKSISKFTYDLAGNLTKKIEAFGQAEQRTTDYAYDAMDRVKTITHDVIAAANSATGANVTPIEYFYYDAVGNLTEKRDGFGARTAYWYDALGRVEYEFAASETVSGNQNGTFTRNIYDANDNIIEKRVFADLVTLPGSPGGTRPNAPVSYRKTLYGYDKLNQLVTVSTPDVGRAVYAGVTLTVTATTTLVTTYEYDANGNVIRTTDGKGAQTYSYYDKLGRKLTQYDALNFRTDWTYDANGAALSEKRYANAGVAGNSSIPVTPGVLPNLPVLDGTNDRTTTFTNDKMGRRLTETRAGVLVHNGSGGQTPVSAQIVYTYNALGQVATKVEASNDKIAYTFDREGRILSEKRTLNGQSYLYTDAFGTNVAPTVEYTYNGLSDLAQSKSVGNANAGDRTTNFTYGAGGRLLSKSDAAAFVRTYVYDAAGRVVREQYTRVTPTGSSDEAVGYDYDLMGRVVAQGLMAKVGGVYTRSVTNALGQSIDTVMMHYNAFGEVSERGINGLYAEKFEYDGAGRIVRTNSGDGAWKYFMYDGAGNQTLMIQSVGTDLNAAATDTLAEVLALWTGGTGTIATANVAGVIATITRYDGRNQAVEVREPQRQRNATTSNDLTTTRTYNAFGEIISEINAAGAQVDYTYNTMGRRIKVESPTVSVTAENGAVSNVRPTENFYFDAAGRLVAQRDANGNLTRYTLLAGSGYGGASSLITEVIGADTSVVRTKYDIQGDARRIEDALYVSGSPNTHVTIQGFDAMGRLISMNRSNIITEYYGYDGLGQRIKHWNSFYNANGLATNNVELTAYDLQGRVTSLTTMGGDVTSYLYGWDSSFSTNGMGASGGAATFGGWTQQTTYANTKTMSEKTDMFGRAIGKVDMGAHITNYTYDMAGRLTQRSANQVINNIVFAVGVPLYQSYFNTGRLKEIWQNSGSQAGPGAGAYMISTETFSYRGTKFGYDIVGNVVSQELRETGTHHYETAGHIDGEGYWEPGEAFDDPFDRVLTNQTASFDSLGRTIAWNELGGTLSPISSHVFAYDANGNIRRSLATYRVLDAQGNAAATNTTQDYWYRYDAMNRMVTSKGAFTGVAGSGSIARGTTGVDTFYNFDGTRSYTLTSFMANWFGGQVANTRREEYTYDALARVTQVKAGDGTVSFLTGQVTQPTSASVTVRGTFVYDALGRLTSQIDKDGAGTVAYSRTASYNAKNQVTTDDVSAWQSGALFRSLSTYSYGSGSSYALGAATQIDTVKWKNGSAGEPDTQTINTYQWWDGAVQSTTSYDADIAYIYNTPWLSTYNYNVVGGQVQMASVDIADGRPRTVKFGTDMLGQVFRRDEKDNLAGGDPHEVWYRYSGRQMGYVGNNGTTDVTYVDSVNQRAGTISPTSFADFDLAYDPINAYEQGSSGGMYTVQSGDTLQSIASNLWGDASLWYKIAEVNGLTAESVLVEGQPLIIPVGVQTNAHNATTFKPYDPLEVLGSTSPTSPTPPKAKQGCGGIGQVLLAVIAIVVVAIIAPGLAGGFGSMLNGGSFAAGFSAGMGASSLSAAAAVGAKIGVYAAGSAGIASGSVAAAVVAGGAVAGAVGSIVSQGVGVMTGIQEKFSWNAVAMAAIGGGVGAGVGARFPGAQAITRAVTSNVITQGISVATGLQDNFSWAGVAAAGVGAWAASAVNINSPFDVARNGASLIADAAIRSLIEGSDFGDNIMAALPNVIGQTIGEAIAGTHSERGADRAAEDPSTVQNRLRLLQQAFGPMEIPELDALMNWSSEMAADFDTMVGAQVENYPVMLNSMGQGFLRSGYRDDARIVQHTDGTGIVFNGGASLAGQWLVYQTITSVAGARSRVIGPNGRAYDVFNGSRIEEIGLKVSVGRPAAISDADRAIAYAPRDARRAAEQAAMYEEFLSQSFAVRDYVNQNIDLPAVVAAGGVVAVGATLGAVIVAAPYILANPATALAIFENGAGLVPGMEAATTVTGLGAVGVAAHRVGVLDEIGDTAGSILRRVACFVAGTPIHTRDGIKAIERIKVGDLVWSRSEHDVGEASWRKVTEWARTGEQKIYEVYVEAHDSRAETYRTTEMHPFWIETGGDGAGGFVAASVLKPGDTVRLADGSAARVVNVESTQVIEPVYNFAVEGWHTYHIGELGVWVHNDVCLGDIPSFSPSGYSAAQQDAINQTVDLINRGVARDHVPEAIRANWGASYRNADGALPSRINGQRVQYREYTIDPAFFNPKAHPVTGELTRGAHRIVVGTTTGGQTYRFFTPSHYGEAGGTAFFRWR